MYRQFGTASVVVDVVRRGAAGVSAFATGASSSCCRGSLCGRGGGSGSWLGSCGGGCCRFSGSRRGGAGVGKAKDVALRALLHWLDWAGKSGRGQGK